MALFIEDSSVSVMFPLAVATAFERGLGLPNANPK